MCIPSALLKAFEDARLGIFAVTPAWMRSHLKESQGGRGSRLLKADGRRSLVLNLLQYCLTDMTLGAPPGVCWFRGVKAERRERRRGRGDRRKEGRKEK